MCEVMEDYLTNPYQAGAGAMPRNRSQSVSSRAGQIHEGARNTPLRASSFSPGSLTVRDRLSFPKLSFRSRSSSVSAFSSSSSSSSSLSVTTHTSGASEQFWNQYRRSRPRSSFTKLLRRALSNCQAMKERPNIAAKTEDPQTVHC